MELNVGDKVLYGHGNHYQFNTVAKVTNTQATLDNGVRVKRESTRRAFMGTIPNACEMPIIGSTYNSMVASFPASSHADAVAYLEKQESENRDRHLIVDARNLLTSISNTKAISPSQRKALEDIVASFS